MNINKHKEFSIFLKNGSKIHIKDSQKGSFTKYCKGKVTNECIQKGKNSPNPKIRKKAIFAQNSRKWVKKAEEGANTNSFLNSENKSNLINAGLGILSGINSIKQSNKLKSSFNDYNQNYRKMLEQQALSNIDVSAIDDFINNQENPNAFGGSIVKNNLINKLKRQSLQQASGQINQKILELQNRQNSSINDLKQSGQNSLFGGLENLLNIGMDYYNNKSKTSINNPIKSPLTNTTFDSYLKSQTGRIATIRQQPNTN